MGTLFDQKPRGNYLTKEVFISKGQLIKEVAKELGINFSEAIELYLAVASINDYDIKDEQLMGFGNLLMELTRYWKIRPNCITNIKRHDAPELKQLLSSRLVPFYV